MHALLEDLRETAADRLRKKRQPSWTQPMLATRSHETFSHRDWIYERKLDGERTLAFCRGTDVRLLSRNKQQLNRTYPEIADALSDGRRSPMIVDGEIVAFDGQVTSFKRLQDRLQISNPEEARNSGIAVYYYLFDVLHFDGYDLTKLPLRVRKQLLRKAVSYEDPLRFTRHRNEDGEEYYRQACSKRWEGLIAKHAQSRYVHGRSKQWLKFRCENRQEFVIGGFTEPEGDRVGFGALLVGYYERGGLRYAGKVGTGFDDDMLQKLRTRMERHERRSSPFADKAKRRKGEHWTAPKLVAELGFTTWTDDLRLRHPRFLGLRRDKKPRNVVRET